MQIMSEGVREEGRGFKKDKRGRNVNLRQTIFGMKHDLQGLIKFCNLALSAQIVIV